MRSAGGMGNPLHGRDKLYNPPHLGLVHLQVVDTVFMLLQVVLFCQVIQSFLTLEGKSIAASINKHYISNIYPPTTTIEKKWPGVQFSSSQVENCTCSQDFTLPQHLQGPIPKTQKLRLPTYL